MKRAALLTALAGLALAACGGTPSTPEPPELAFPSLVGGWGGTWTYTAVALATGARDSRACSESWTVTQQAGADFMGTMQRSGPEGCAAATSFSGTVDRNGSVRFGRAENTFTTPQGPCTIVGGDGMFRGIASFSTLSAQMIQTARCPEPGGGTADYQLSVALSLSRR